MNTNNQIYYAPVWSFKSFNFHHLTKRTITFSLQLIEHKKDHYTRSWTSKSWPGIFTKMCQGSRVVLFSVIIFNIVCILYVVTIFTGFPTTVPYIASRHICLFTKSFTGIPLVSTVVSYNKQTLHQYSLSTVSFCQWAFVYGKHG
jgi:hypothetical protein